MPNKFKFEITSLDGKYFEDEVDALYFDVPEKGRTGLLANHTPYFAMLFIGILYTVKGDDKEYFTYSSGTLRFENNVASIFVDTFERANELDRERIESEKKKAEAILASEQDSLSYRYQKAVYTLKKATNRLKLLK